MDDGESTLIDGSIFVMAENISAAERYCRCRNMETCRCGEIDQETEWLWDDANKTTECALSKGGKEVTFHPRFSIGTACVRADRALRDGYQHYFEVKILSPCFGTDVMIGVGTDKADIHKHERIFGSLLGSCNQTWGLSYRGGVYHNDEWTQFSANFGQGSLVGVHLDLWHGSLSYYINRKLVGVAFANLRNSSNDYYPMVCSTAARTRFRLIAARSHATDLKFLCCNVVRKSVPLGERFLPDVALPPILKQSLENNLNWLIVGVVDSSKNGKKRSIRDVDDDDDKDDDDTDTDAGGDIATTSASSSTVDSLYQSIERTRNSLRRSQRRARRRMDRFSHRMALVPAPLTVRTDFSAGGLRASSSSMEQQQPPLSAPEPGYHPFQPGSSTLQRRGEDQGRPRDHQQRERYSEPVSKCERLS